jgi:transcription antitermination factor NusG
MTGNLAKVYRALYDGQIKIGTVIGYGDADPIYAEAKAGVLAAWYLIETKPGQERVAAAHLSARRFGIYVPEVDRLEFRRGRRGQFKRPMFPGYIFVYVWGIKDHIERIEACPGVFRMMLQHDPETWASSFVVLPDEVIDKIRVIENGQRPVILPLEEFNQQRQKRRWRRTPRPEQRISDNEIVGVRAWSAFTDGLAASVDGAQRNQILRKALGLPS